MGFLKLSLIVVLACILAPAMARNLPLESSHDLEARLQGEGGFTQCWNALFELRSCSNEIVLFFLNGESYLGLDCCRAIRVITRQCWPSMLASIGFTAQEGDILRGYCDATTAPPDWTGTPPPSSAPLGSVGAGVVVSEELVV
ncbi:egg cell-secreted protein 1.2-like [Tasmannia lanceolata]|uniref:egg cell-secreted protein 1.2-like n=1 Tax=Tasmannia lanceolata TaxID=3420 RepID=UPI0040632935